MCQLRPMLEFINDVINRGESVLVHCLAGAHRAGTTGTLLLILSIIHRKNNFHFRDNLFDALPRHFNGGRGAACQVEAADN